MKSQIPLFRFTIRSGQSIGPAALRSLWSRACGNPDVSVGRKEVAGTPVRHVYSLYASQKLDLHSVEQRLRVLFAASRLDVALTVLHGV